jgi:four helix bundle protein
MKNYNDEFRERTKRFAIDLCKAFDDLPYKESTRIVKKQILRSGTSVAANFRSACRARSTAEYYSKLCIVVEECDETVFWLELIEDLLPNQNKLFLLLHKEAIELLNVFSSTKKKLKEKLYKNK